MKSDATSSTRDSDAGGGWCSFVARRVVAFKQRVQGSSPLLMSTTWRHGARDEGNIPHLPSGNITTVGYGEWEQVFWEEGGLPRPHEPRAAGREGDREPARLLAIHLPLGSSLAGVTVPGVCPRPVLVSPPATNHFRMP